MDDHTSNEYMNEFVHQMGRMIIAASLFDDDLTNLLSECFCLLPLQENALLRPLSTRAKAELLARVGKLFLTEDRMKPINAWCTTVKATLDERNELIHGSPGHKDGKIHFRSYGGKHRMLGKSDAWDTQRVSDLADRFSGFSDEVGKLRSAPFSEWIEVALAMLRSQFASEQTPQGK
jgi:hypothetical protein